MEETGKIIKSLSGFYYILLENGDIITSRARGNFRNNNITPLVGDIVNVKIEDDSIGYITTIKERDNELLRPKVANIDYNVIVTSVKDPDFSSKLLDKMVVLAEYSSVPSIIIFTKLDLLSDEYLKKFNSIMDYYKEIGYVVLTNSSEDIAKFKTIVSNKFISISGQSGSGKSTFINNLSNGVLNIETAKISKALGRGKHTTRHTEFHKIDDFYIADTPGFSSLDITFIYKEDIKYLFKEFSATNCKYQTCNHIDEPSCQIKIELENDCNKYFDRYENYKNMFNEKKEQKRRY
ncbi:ribosome small subunit-dependent GTPase A [Gemella sp. GH3]|nr:ribosome small subunit-dependent GTPase A [Gemella sp. GH3.1]NYS50198.1 ribosome small subunit-dependent GTPase A [Gemella sp. GH3]